MDSNSSVSSSSTPNSRVSSPLLPLNSVHGGSRPDTGRKKEKKRTRVAITTAASTAALTTLHHRQRLAECMSLLSNPTGRSLSTNELRIIIRLAMWLQYHDNFTESHAIDSASIWSGSGRHTIESAYHHYLKTNELIEPATW